MDLWEFWMMSIVCRCGMTTWLRCPGENDLPFFKQITFFSWHHDLRFACSNLFSQFSPDLRWNGTMEKGTMIVTLCRCFVEVKWKNPPGQQGNVQSPTWLCHVFRLAKDQLFATKHFFGTCQLGNANNMFFCYTIYYIFESDLFLLFVLMVISPVFVSYSSYCCPVTNFNRATYWLNWNKICKHSTASYNHVGGKHFFSSGSVCPCYHWICLYAGWHQLQFRNGALFGFLVLRIAFMNFMVFFLVQTSCHWKCLTGSQGKMFIYKVWTSERNWKYFPVGRPFVDEFMRVSWSPDFKSVLAHSKLLANMVALTRLCSLAIDIVLHATVWRLISEIDKHDRTLSYLFEKYTELLSIGCWCQPG